LIQLFSIIGGVLGAFGAWTWHLSAQAQETLNAVSNTSSADFKSAVAMSLTLNTQAALIAGIAAICTCIALFLSTFLKAD
jgi:hypothetical protein